MDLLHITWRDAFDHDEVGWITNDQMDRLLSLDAVVESVGFKYHEDDKYITIVGDHEGDSFSRATRIPKGMIIKCGQLLEQKEQEYDEKTRPT